MLVRTSFSLNVLVDLGMYSYYVDSPFVFWAAHDDHAFLLVLAVFVVGMTVFSYSRWSLEEGVLDVAALTNQTLHTSTSGWQVGRLRATREVSKACGSPSR